VGVFGTVLQVAGFAIAVPYGIAWVAASHVLAAYAVAPITMVAAARELRTTVAATLSGVVGPLLSAGVMAIVLVFARYELDGVSPLVRLIALGALAALVYPVVLRLLGRRAFDEAVEYLRGVLQGRLSRAIRR
jgi:hypothetical protein